MTEKKLPLERFYHMESKYPNRTYLRQPLNGQWIDFSWSEVGLQARKLTASIFAMKLPLTAHLYWC
jgi:long-chain acyl-CoA synthetase